MYTQKFQWTVDKTIELIQLYEEHDMLYNNINIDYKNRNKRNDLYSAFAEKIGCAPIDIRKKINSLRTQYAGERLKIEKSKRNGIDGEIYKPSVYWFPMLSFLNQWTSTNTSESQFDGFEFATTDDSFFEVESKPLGSDQDDVYTPRLCYYDSDNESERDVKRVRRMTETQKEQRDWASNDPCEARGRTVASDLREMPVQQRWLAERLISDICYYGKVGKLTDTTSINLSYKERSIPGDE